MRAHPEGDITRQAAATGATGVLASRGLRWILAALFSLHGLIHLMGVASIWGLDGANGVSPVPTFPAGLVAGSPLALALGALWLVALVGFLVAAVGVARGAGWWKGVTAGAAALSLALCLAWWHDAFAGVGVNIVILAGLAIQSWAARPRAAERSLS